jgi:hypothetical protein
VGTKRIIGAVLVGFVMAAPGVAAEPALKVKAESLDPPAQLAEPVRKLLGPDALVVTEVDGTAVLTLWLRRAIPAQATAEQVKNGLTYREIPEGTLLGAVRFAKTFVDYRKQEIAAGVYTLRFAVQPDVGDHMGTAPYPEFALLSPAEKDTSAESLEVKALIKLSVGSTGGDHPGVMLLYPHTGSDAAPKLAGKGNGVVVLTTRRTVETETAKTLLGFALTVAGHSKSR